MKKGLYKSKRVVFTLLTAILASEVFAENDFKRIEINPAISFYTADALRTSFAGALQVDYRFNRTFWVGASGFWGKAAVDSGGGTFAKDGDDWFGVEGNFYYNMPGILGDKDSGNAVDLFTSVGIGYLQIGSEKEPMGMIGGGMLIHFPVSWISLRFDLKNYMYVLQNTGGTNFNSDLTLLLGPSFLF